MGTPRGPLTAAAWDHRYQQGDTPWDHGGPAPGLIEFLKRNNYPPGQVLVPGCGTGHDCLALARHGFEVTGLDISTTAIREARRRVRELRTAAPRRVTFVRGDCLNMPARLRGRFDWVFEHTCYCAIPPDRRDAYARAMRLALKPGGLLLGIFFVIAVEEGPPFGATRKELLDRFGPGFELLAEQIPRSWPHRRGEERLFLWRKRPAGAPRSDRERVDSLGKTRFYQRRTSATANRYRRSAR